MRGMIPQIFYLLFEFFPSAEVQLQHVGTTDELPSSYQEALATFKRWIGDVENVLKSESVNISDVDSMEQRMTQFKVLQ